MRLLLPRASNGGMSQHVPASMSLHVPQSDSHVLRRALRVAGIDSEAQRGAGHSTGDAKV